jgi:nucleoside permease NupC
MECIFSEPQEIATGTWAFSKVACDDPHYELIQNASTGAEFYIGKTMTYGETIVVVFLTLFSILLICSLIWRFFWKK